MFSNIKKDKEKFFDQLHHKINKVEDIEVEDEHLCQLLKKPAHKLRQELIENKDLKMTTIMQHYHQLKKHEQNQHNNLVEVMYDEPLKRCKELDEKREKDELNYEEKKLVGFYMSIKDSLKFKGTSCTNGFYINLHKKCDKNVPTVKHLLDQGVIFLSKGSIPQGVFSMECSSNIFGAGLNPYNKKRTPGGSSGGDSALVRLGLVNCALGSDIAGSLRIPALFNGIVTLKPTVPRIRLDVFTEFFQYQDDWTNYPDFQTYLLPTAGPLTRNVEDCERLMEVMVSDVTHDMFSPPLPWKKVHDLPKKIGCLKELDFCEVSGANKRAVEEAKKILQKKGVEIVELDLNKEMRELYVLALAIYWQVPALKGLITKQKNIKEGLVRDFWEITLLLRTPKIFYPLVKKILKLTGNDRISLSVVAADLSKSVNNSYLTEQRFDLYNRIVQKIKTLDIECFLSFGLATPAITHNSFSKVYLQSIYTFMFNFLNFPAGVVPVTRVRESEQVYQSKFDDIITKGMKEVMKDSKDLPVGIQIAALPWRDELVMRVMREVEKGVSENFECPFQKTFEKK